MKLYQNVQKNIKSLLLKHEKKVFKKIKFYEDKKAIYTHPNTRDNF